MRIAIAALLLAACVEETPSSQSPKRTISRSNKIEMHPGPSNFWWADATCSEFDWQTNRGEATLVCRVLWCREGETSHAAIGGPAVLWCAPVTDGGAP